jgi:hypothetical protein
MVDERQVIWLQSTATRFAAICDLCIVEVDEEPSPLAYWSAKVDGSLRIDADIGFVRCRRGHRLSVKRVARAPLAAVSGGQR